MVCFVLAGDPGLIIFFDRATNAGTRSQWILFWSRKNWWLIPSNIIFLILQYFFDLAAAFWPFGHSSSISTMIVVFGRSMDISSSSNRRLPSRSRSPARPDMRRGFFRFEHGENAMAFSAIRPLHLNFHDECRFWKEHGYFKFFGSSFAFFSIPESCKVRHAQGIFSVWKKMSLNWESKTSNVLQESSFHGENAMAFRPFGHSTWISMMGVVFGRSLAISSSLNRRLPSRSRSPARSDMRRGISVWKKMSLNWESKTSNVLQESSFHGENAMAFRPFGHSTWISMMGVVFGRSLAISSSSNRRLPSSRSRSPARSDMRRGFFRFERRWLWTESQKSSNFLQESSFHGENAMAFRPFGHSTWISMMGVVFGRSLAISSSSNRRLPSRSRSPARPDMHRGISVWKKMSLNWEPKIINFLHQKKSWVEMWLHLLPGLQRHPGFFKTNP